MTPHYCTYPATVDNGRAGVWQQSNLLSLLPTGKPRYLHSLETKQSSSQRLQQPPHSRKLDTQRLQVGFGILKHYRWQCSNWFLFWLHWFFICSISEAACQPAQSAFSTIFDTAVAQLTKLPKQGDLGKKKRTDEKRYVTSKQHSTNHRIVLTNT